MNLLWTAEPASSDITGYTIQASSNGGAYATVATATGTATSATVTGLTPNTAYTFLITATNASGTSPNSNTATTTTPPAVTTTPTTLLAGWNNADIGALALAGSASYNNGTFTVSGAGTDIWNADDQFQFVSQPDSGNGTLIAQVASQTNTNAWAKAGVMIRASSAANSPFVDVVQTPGNGVDLQWRDTSGNLNWTAGPTIADPAWVKLHARRKYLHGLCLRRRQYMDNHWVGNDCNVHFDSRRPRRDQSQRGGRQYRDL